MVGVPGSHGLRIPGAMVVGIVTGGRSHQEIREAFPDLEGEDIRETLHYAAAARITPG
jgi:uncharacterized protein (DUF433 family)